MSTYFNAFKRDGDKIRTAFFVSEEVDGLPPKEAIKVMYPVIWNHWEQTGSEWNTCSSFELESLNPNNDGTHQRQWDLAIALLDGEPSLSKTMEIRSENITFYFLQ